MCEVSIGVFLKWYFICCRPNSLVQTIGVTSTPKLAKAAATLMAFPPCWSVWGIPSKLPPFRLATSATNSENSAASQSKVYDSIKEEIGQNSDFAFFWFFFQKAKQFCFAVCRGHGKAPIEVKFQKAKITF